MFKITYKRIYLTIVLFVTMVLFGFAAENHIVQSSELVKLNDLAQEMTKVLAALEPMLKPKAGQTTRNTLISNKDSLKSLVSRSIISALPDGTWNLDAPVTRGEAVFYLSKLLNRLKTELVHPPLILPFTHDFADIVPTHWLSEFLPELNGIGVLKSFEGSLFKPDDRINKSELRAATKALIDYLGNNLLILSFDGESAVVRAKGAMQPLKIENWTYSTNRSDWYQIDRNGIVIPDFSSNGMVTVFFRRNDYLDAGPILLNSMRKAVFMIKLKRDYATMNSTKQLQQPAIQHVDSEEERNIIRKRLAQIRQRKDQPPEKPKVEKAPEPVIKKEPVVEKSETATKINTFEGIIIDAITQKPIQGAIVITEARQYTADHRGQFTFESEPHKIIDVTAYSEGYEAIKIRHRVGYRSGPLTLRLKPVLTEFYGRVISIYDNLPVSGAVVRVGNRATRSGSDGSFSFKRLKPGYHQISVFAQDYMEAHEIVHTDPKIKQEKTLILKPIIEQY